MRSFIVVAILVATFNFCIAPGVFATFFTVPFKATVYVQSLGGEAGAVTEFGLLEDGMTVTPLITGLPYSPEPNSEVAVGVFNAGWPLEFYLYSEFGGTYWAYSNAQDDASRVAFTDTAKILGLGGSVVVPSGPSTWVLYLDDAPSYLFDDDNNYVFIQLRLAAVPEPTSITAAAHGCLLSFRRRNFKCVNHSNLEG